MKRSLFSVAALFALAALASPALGLPRPQFDSAPAFQPGELLVALPEDQAFAQGTRGEPMAADAAMAGLLAREGLVLARWLGRGNAAARAGVLGSRFALLRSAHPDFDPVASAAKLRASGRFAAVTPNYRLRLHDTLPNDTYLPYQWSIDDVGGSDIRLPAAWDVTTGSGSAVIAILDTGVDTGHPDLASKIWTNPGEIPGDAIDNDSNGYVDDVNGWDFGNLDADPNPGPIIDAIGIDVGFHGTFCAGIAAAATNNGVGIAGAAWNCPVMPLRIFTDAGEAGTAELTDAVAYAVDNGAAVISMSIGTPDEPGVPEFFQSLMDLAHAAGVVCVASAGNDGVNSPLVYPAACDHVISVAATTYTNERAEFSNWGSWVDVAAPGSLMWSSIARNYEVDELNQIFYLYFFYWDGENPYMYGDGTSFACPLVAGVCALVRSQLPALDSDQMAALLISTGTPVVYDLPIGPKVNAQDAVTFGATGVAGGPAAEGFALASPWPNPSAGASRLRFTLAAPATVELAIFDAAGRRVATVANGAFGAGGHDAAWSGRDEAGRALPAGLYFARLTSAGRIATTRIVRLEP